MRTARHAIAVVPLLVVLIAAACAPSDGSSAPETPGAEVSAVADDWNVLFDGSSTAALRGYGQSGFPASWVVQDGELRTVPGAGVDLISRETFTDFELEFEWRVSPAGNSGLIYRVRESDQPSWASGPEYQVLDDAGHPDGGDPRTAAAALYGLIAPDGDKRLDPVGHFNTGRIVIERGHVEHWLNGSLVVEYEWGGSDVRSLIAASKFADTPDFMSADTGAVVLQHHGEEVWFRNIRIRRLG